MSDLLTLKNLGEGESLVEWGAYRKEWMGTEFSDDFKYQIFGQRIVSGKTLEELKSSAIKYAAYSEGFKDWRSEHPNEWYPWEEDPDGSEGYRFLYRQIDQPNDVPHKDYLYVSIHYPREGETDGGS